MTARVADHGNKAEFVVSWPGLGAVAVLRPIDGEVMEHEVQALVLNAGKNEMTPKERACRVCGCTQDAACLTNGVACHWVDDDLCSACDVRTDGLAIAAASAATEAAAELLRFAREGNLDVVNDQPFIGDVVEQLLDAAKMAMQIDGWHHRDAGERGKVFAAVSQAIEGWA